MINKKIVSRPVLAKILSSAVKKNKKVVFTNGCFDILHKGHVKYLADAKSLGDILVVAINSDNSVRSIKGKNRPINKAKDRAYILAALGSVDFVTIFNELTPEKTIKLLKPNILVKGADWKVSDIVGGSFVRSYGGVVKNIKFLKNYSTSSLIDKIIKLV